MYRINILDGGQYHNVKTGYRYCLTKRKVAKGLAQFEGEWGCECEVEHFFRCGGFWVWGDFTWEIDEYLEKHTIKGYNRV